MRNCRHFRRLLGGPAEWGTTQIHIKPRCPRGARSGEKVATFEGCWEAQRSEAPPKLILNLAIPRSAGAYSGVRPQSDSDLTSPSLGGCDLRNCHHFRMLPGGPAESGPTQIQIRLRHPWRAANYETVATFESCWGSSGGTRYADSDWTSPPLRGCGLRNCRHFRRLLAAQGAWRRRRSWRSS